MEAVGAGAALAKLPAASSFEFNDALLLAQAALMGCGVAWVRASLVQGFVEEGRLQVLARSEQVSDKAVWLVCREDAADLSAVRAFFSWAESLAQYSAVL
jgi:DNA-binding transcriptional LysR family regulator